MPNGIEVYVRPSGDQIMLNIHSSDAVRSALLEALTKGSFEAKAYPTHLEISVLPEWITSDQDEAIYAVRQLGSIHIRVPIDSINMRNE